MTVNVLIEKLGSLGGQTAQEKPAVLLAFRRHVESFAHFPYSLASCGFRVEAAFTRYTRHIRLSRAVSREHPLPYEAPAFAAALNELVDAGEFALVILVDEPALTAVYANPIGETLSHSLPMLPGSDLANTVGRKDRFHEFVEANGIPSPVTRNVKGPRAAREAAQSTGLPVVLKGISGSSGNSVQIIRTPDQLEPALAAFGDDETILVQEFIEGITAAATFFAWRGSLRAWIATSKHIALSKGKGPTVVADFINHPEVGRICEAFARLGGIHGITGFDFILDTRNRVFVIDPHFGRMTTLAHFGPFCGVDFGRALREAIDGSETRQDPVDCPERVVKFPEFMILIHEGGLFRLLREASPFNSKVRYFISQPGEWRLSLSLFLLTCKSLLFCFLGAIKARVRRAMTA